MPSTVNETSTGTHHAVDHAGVSISGCCDLISASISAKADEVIGEGKFAPGYKREYFEGAEHGFAVRGNMTDPVVKKAKEGAFESAVAWFIEKL